MSTPSESHRDEAGHRGRRFFRRRPWESGSAAIIGLGILMLMQPFALALYTWSFVVILIGTGAFLITSHFPE